MKVKVYVTLKRGVLDPQGKAIRNSLKSLGYDEVKDVRLGKFIELNIDDNTEQSIKGRIDEMSKKLLANTVIEDFRYEFEK